MLANGMMLAADKKSMASIFMNDPKVGGGYVGASGAGSRRGNDRADDKPGILKRSKYGGVYTVREWGGRCEGGNEHEVDTTFQWGDVEDEVERIRVEEEVRRR